MSIRVVCPNGHLLKIKSKYAGKSGLCPICKGRIVVPKPEPDTLSEDSIMDVLDPHESGLSGKALEMSDSHAELVEKETEEWWEAHDAPLKICARCDKEIPSDAHVCPFCKTYVVSLHGLCDEESVFLTNTQETS